MSEQEHAVYVQAHLVWARQHDAAAEQAVEAGHADEAAGALARAVEHRRLAAEEDQVPVAFRPATRRTGR